MSSHNIFIIGAGGHIGSSVLDGFKGLELDGQVTALVRDVKDSNMISEIYPGVRVVIGTMEDLDVLKDEASKASIVINTAPDMPYQAGIRTILTALSVQSGETFYIHTSGAALIWDQPTGSASDRVWDDVADIAELQSFPDTATHAASDRLVAQFASSLSPSPSKLLHTAIVAPPDVFGLSASPKRRTPLVLPDMVGVARRVGGPFSVGPGNNRLALVDVRHLATVYLRLVADALERLRNPEASKATTAEEEGHIIQGGVEIWGPRAYFFLTTAELVWRELIAELIVPVLKKYGKDVVDMSLAVGAEEMRRVTMDELSDHVFARFGGVDGAHVWSRHIAENFAINMRVRGSRALNAFGIRPEDGQINIEMDVKALLGVL